MTSTGTAYLSIAGVERIQLTETHRIITPIDTVWKNLKVWVQDAPSGGTFVVTLMKSTGGAFSATALTATVADGGTSATDISNEINANDGEQWVLKVVSTGSVPPGNFWISLESWSTDVDTSFWSWMTGSGDPTNYQGTIAPYQNWDATLNSRESVIPFNCTVTSIYLRSEQNQVHGDADFYMMLDGVKQDGTGGTVDTHLNVPVGTGTSVSNVQFALPVTRGQRLAIKREGAIGTYSWTVAFGVRASVAGECGVGSIGTLINSAQNWGFPTGSITGFITGTDGNYSATQTSAALKVGITGFSYTYPHARLLSGVTPGSGKSYLLEIAKNGSTPAFNVPITLSDAETQDSYTLNRSVSFVTDDTISISATPSGSPTAGNLMYAMVVGAHPYQAMSPLTPMRFLFRIHKNILADPVASNPRRRCT